MSVVNPSFVKTYELEEAEGELAEIYADLTKSRNGRLPGALKSMSLNPEALLAVMRLNNTITFGASSLGRRREEMIATVVSAMNDCDY